MKDGAVGRQGGLACTYALLEARLPRKVLGSLSRAALRGYGCRYRYRCSWGYRFVAVSMTLGVLEMELQGSFKGVWGDMRQIFT